MRRFVLRASLVALLGIGSVGTSAQPAYPFTPDPVDCQIAPRPIASVIAVAGTPAAGAPAPAASPTAFVRTMGAAADAATTEAVTATVHEVFACANAGDFLRVYALFTDEYLRVFLAGTPMSDAVIAFFTASPVPLPEAEKRIIVRIGEVQLFPDGRAGVVVVLDEPDDPRTEEPDFIYLEQVGDRWLLDEVIEDGGLAGTPVSGTPVS